MAQKKSEGHQILTTQCKQTLCEGQKKTEDDTKNTKQGSHETDDEGIAQTKGTIVFLSDDVISTCQLDCECLELKF